MPDTFDTDNLRTAAVLWYIARYEDGKAEPLDSVEPIGNTGKMLYKFPGRELQRFRFNDYRAGKVRVEPYRFMEAYEAVRDYKYGRNQ